MKIPRIVAPAGGWTAREYAIMRTEPVFEILDKPPLWEREPDQVIWTTDDGYTGIVRRARGHLSLNGYLVLNHSRHPWWGKGYDDIPDVEVHGGLTFADTVVHLRDWDGDSIMGHTAYARGSDTWTVGFDCAHSGDLVPGLRLRMPGEETYRDVEYVYKQVWKLIRQARKAAAK